MKKWIALLMFLFIFVVAPYTFSEEGNPEQILNNILIKIPERTVVPLTLVQNIKGSGVLVGSTVDFRVTRNIIIDDYIVIKRCDLGEGTVYRIRDCSDTIFHRDDYTRLEWIRASLPKGCFLRRWHFSSQPPRCIIEIHCSVSRIGHRL